MNNMNLLDEHKIIRIDTKKIRTRYPRLYGKNSRLPEHSYGVDCLIYNIFTDKGASGWGLGRLPLTQSNEAFTSSLIGKCVSELFNPKIGILNKELIPLDFALHDLAGVILNIPVYKMLGNEIDQHINCYDGAIYMNDISPSSRPGGLQSIIDDCKQDYDMGYSSFKLKIGRGGMWMDKEEGLKRDIEVTRAVRKHFPNCSILVDGNDAFTIDTLLRYLDAVSDCDLFWVEEPFKENREDLLKLKEFLAKKSPRTLVADGEFDPDVDLVLSLAEEKLIDVLLMDIEGFGFTNWRKLMSRISDKNYLISPHCWPLKLKTHYSAHFAAAFKNTITIEGVPDETEGVDFKDYKLTNGYIYVPDKPGFGMDFIWGRNI
ncbi:MAG TPA: enolase C-terminal domain-like protein [Ruminiclostridium sp.]